MTLTEIATFWKTINWIYVSLFWTCLYDFGQVNPTLYNTSDQNFPFANATSLPSTNNIFINPALFQTYGSFLQTTILPILNNSPPNFNPVDEGNQLQPTNCTFLRSYSCRELQRKRLISVIQQILVADYVLAHGSYLLICKLLGYYYKYHDVKGMTLIEKAKVQRITARGVRTRGHGRELSLTVKFSQMENLIII
jgi:hypothetical protein